MQPFVGDPEDLERRVKLYHLMLYEFVRTPRSYGSDDTPLLRIFVIGLMLIGLTFIAGLVTLLFIWIAALMF